MSYTLEKSPEFELETGVKITVDISIELEDISYGEDADGLRGCKLTDIVDFEVECPEQKLTPEEQYELACYVNDYVNRFEWE